MESGPYHHMTGMSYGGGGGMGGGLANLMMGG